MKALMCALFLLCTAAAFAQTAGGVLNSQVSVFQMPSHPEHASYAQMGREHSLAEQSVYIIAKGERPLWEVAPLKETVPLGDIARALREEHARAPKAQFVRAD